MIHRCKHCGRDDFESGPKLAGHVTNVHRRPRVKTWEEFTKNCQRKVVLVLVQERGHRCEVCGLSEWMDRPIPIEIDHIDGNNENHDKINLRLLCPNCHAQTPTYKGRNIGKHDTKTSAYRRKYHARTRALVA